MQKLLLLAGIAGLGWTATLPEPNTTEIVQRSTQQTTANWDRAPEYSFVERDAESKRESQPSAKTYQVLQIDGSPYNRLVAVGDQPLSASQQDEEERKLRNEIQKRQRESEKEREKRIEKYLKGQRQDRALLSGMMEAFDFQLTGHEMMDGRDCWVLDANPKPGYKPKNREMKVLAGMRGRFWIDKETGHWAKVQAEVFQTVSLAGFFAKVRPGTRFLLEQAPIAGGVWLPKHLSTHVTASALGFINGDSIEDETYSDYKPIREALSRLGPHN
jgi:hypothetical protein